jgi:predicted secreted acid phosphatase
MAAAVVTKSFNQFLPVVQTLLSHASGQSHVVVFDIDATVLYNTGSNQCGAVPNTKVKRIYDMAMKKGVPVYFVTARIGLPSNRAATVEQLQCMGMGRFQDLYMRTGQDRTVAEIARFKARSRADIERRTGKQVLLNIGDQWSDVVVAPPSAYDTLDAKYKGQHVLFYPPPEFHALAAIKLYETRD